MVEIEIDRRDHIVNILWTGGWDSTYRIVELSRQVCTVQPIYVYGDNRLSEKYEIKAMQKIIEELNNRKETKAKLLPIKFIDKNSIPLNDEITKAFDQISKETQLGSQHEWLARLAYNCPGLELGTEAAPLEVSNILTAINKYGELKKDESSGGYILNPYKSKKNVMLVLGNFNFPIIKKTGHDMKENILLWGYEHIMKNVWVCHTPFFGKPCGLCHPCELKIETGMDFLLTNSALKRYNKRKNQPYKTIYKIARKISIHIERTKKYEQKIKS